jgi:hypothetical protein
VTSRPSLDAPDVVDFIRTNHDAFLFCRDAARHPIGYAVRSVAYRSASRDLYFSTYTKSPKVKHLLADREVACLVGDNAGWVSVRGVAEIYQPSPAEVDDLLGGRAPDQRVPEWVVAKVRDRLLSGKRSFIKVTLADVRAANLAGRHDQ